ncbi:MAG: 2,3-dihydroxybenzoate-AMP ligase [Gammaproteobacteria bacterium]|nr:MAG: 2,3-dihydroxybenzoate-AMP ligase [Gammaproteobacteria bacterium]
MSERVAEGPEFTPWPPELAERYRARGYWIGRPLDHLLRERARQQPDAVALIEGERCCRYAELDRRADRLAAALAGRGLRAGDKVVLQLPNGIAFFELFFALLRLGVVPVLALPAHRERELAAFCRMTGARWLFTAERHAGFAHRELAGRLQAAGVIDRVVVAGEGGPHLALADLDAEAAPLPPVDPAGMAVLQLSGGTTAVPKLIPRSHEDYYYSVRASAELCRLSTADVYLAVLPVAHNFPLTSPGVLGTLWAGGTVVLAPDGVPDRAFDLIEAHGVTVTALVPALALAWLQARRRRALGGRLRLLQVGGAKLDPDGARALQAAFAPAVLQQVFGMAEGLINYTRLDDPPERIAACQGRPLSADDEIRIVDEQDRPVPPGATGLLLTRGPYTIRGYYRAAAHNREAFTADGFYRTGDRVRLTPEGDLVVEGRVKEQINRGGEKIAAAEVEAALRAHPQVFDAAVVAQNDPYLGERSCAFVVPREGARLDLGTLRRFMLEQGWAPYKLPDRLVLLETLPTTGVGKIDKNALRALLARGTDRTG